MRTLGNGVGLSVPSGRVAWALLLVRLFSLSFIFTPVTAGMLQRLVGWSGSGFPRESQANPGGGGLVPEAYIVWKVSVD